MIVCLKSEPKLKMGGPLVSIEKQGIWHESHDMMEECKRMYGSLMFSVVEPVLKEVHEV
jgi:hypothetical protein